MDSTRRTRLTVGSETDINPASGRESPHHCPEGCSVVPLSEVDLLSALQVRITKASYRLLGKKVKRIGLVSKMILCEYHI